MAVYRLLYIYKLLLLLLLLLQFCSYSFPFRSQTYILSRRLICNLAVIVVVGVGLLAAGPEAHNNNNKLYKAAIVKTSITT